MTPRRYSPLQCKPTGLQSFKKRCKIMIVYTGGTIGMVENPETRRLEPFNFDYLIENVPKLRLLDIDIDSFEFEHPIDSSSMNPEYWKDIAGVIEKNYNDYDGFVVLHGTDTMAYTASALSYMLENLNKPVIITGSQLPIGDVRTDGEENLITALQVASAVNPDGTHTVREVAILFEDFLWRGNRSSKHSSDNFCAFSSDNYPPLASIGMGIHFNKEVLLHDEPQGELKVHYEMDTDVMFLDLFPGINETVVKHILSTPDLKGLVIKTFGAGNGPAYPWFIKALKDATERGLVIVNISQCANGFVMPELYEAGLAHAHTGMISGRDLTAEAAITKLMFLFGLGVSVEKVKTLMATPMRGDMSDE